LPHDEVLALMYPSAAIALTSLGFDNQPMTIAPEAGKPVSVGVLQGGCSTPATWRRLRMMMQGLATAQSFALS
jgi:hypothetical protein